MHDSKRQHRHAGTNVLCCSKSAMMVCSPEACAPSNPGVSTTHLPLQKAMKVSVLVHSGENRNDNHSEHVPTTKRARGPSQSVRVSVKSALGLRPEYPPCRWSVALVPGQPANARTCTTQLPSNIRGMPEAINAVVNVELEASAVCDAGMPCCATAAPAARS